MQQPTFSCAEAESDNHESILVNRQGIPQVIHSSELALCSDIPAITSEVLSLSADHEGFLSPVNHMNPPERRTLEQLSESPLHPLDTDFFPHANPAPFSPLDLLADYLGDDMSAASLVDLFRNILTLQGREGMHTISAPPASTVVIESLPRIVVDSGNISSLGSRGECYITQAPFEIGDVCVELPCGHSFKDDHIVRWLSMHNTCPACRVSCDSSNDPQMVDSIEL